MKIEKVIKCLMNNDFYNSKIPIQGIVPAFAPPKYFDFDLKIEDFLFMIWKEKEKRVPASETFGKSTATYNIVYIS